MSVMEERLSLKLMFDSIKKILKVAISYRSIIVSFWPDRQNSALTISKSNDFTVYFGFPLNVDGIAIESEFSGLSVRECYIVSSSPVEFKHATELVLLGSADGSRA